SREYYYEDFKSAKIPERSYAISTSDFAGGGSLSPDGAYTLDIAVTDNAGNIYSHPAITVSKDTVAPTITNFEFTPAGIHEENELLSPQVRDYGFYFQQETIVTITANDAEPSSGISSISYYTVDADGGRSADRTLAVDKNNKITFAVPADFKGQIYAGATDNVGNTPPAFEAPNGVIIASPAKHGETSGIIFTLPATPFADNTGLPLYADNVNLGLKVADAFAGLRKVEWTVTATHDTSNNQNGEFWIANSGNSLYGTIFDGTYNWSVAEMDANLVTAMTSTILVNNNSNDIRVWVRITDRAGNTSEETITFSIDKTVPTIAVTYDNNSTDSVHTGFYNADRVATIVITERNFDAEDVDILITNEGHHGSVTSTVSAWTAVRDSANPDNTTHTATIRYFADGDYTFDIIYSDNANNQAAARAQDRFSIDQTLPVISVTFDNDEFSNSNYCRSARTATIAIFEHNFDASRVTISGTAEYDGVSAVFPSITEWSSSDDVHTANIVFAEDGLYSFSVSFTDMAGNAAASHFVSNFFVDQTAPTLHADSLAEHGRVSVYLEPARDQPSKPLIFDDTNISHIVYVITAFSYIEGDENDGIKIYEMSEITVEENQVDGGTVNLPPELFSVNGVYEIRATAHDLAGNTSIETVHTYVVMRELNMMAYIPSDVLREFHGIHKQAVNFPDIPIHIYTADYEGLNDFQISIGDTFLVSGDYDVRSIAIANHGDNYENVTEHSVLIPNTFIARTFNEDDQIYELPINVNMNYIRTVGLMVINNVHPEGVFENLITGQGFYGVSEQEIRIINLSAGIDEESTTVSVNGQDVSFTYNADAKSIIFMLEESPAYGRPWAGHSVRVTLVDTAGNEFAMEEVRNIYVGNWFLRHWIFFAGGCGILVFAGILLLKFKIAAIGALFAGSRRFPK
ncbi:MAG: Ig-like domain-containing protein, partial [Oscillospiraceae bacterium]|nr:Ig-like domain-containing protein [Oscillospiraceae bacterium]